MLLDLGRLHQSGRTLSRSPVRHSLKRVLHDCSTPSIMPRQLRSSTKLPRPAPYAKIPELATESPPPSAPPSRIKNIPPSDPSATALLFPGPEAFEEWLTTTIHRKSDCTLSPGLWLRLAKKSSPTPDLTYDQALLVALAYGWIDGQRKSLPDDPHYFIQRFTPRRPKSLWSKRNVGIVERLLEGGKMTEWGMKEVEAAKQDGRWEKAYSGGKDIQTPKDFENVLRKTGEAWASWEKLGRGDRYQMLIRLETLRTVQGREKKMRDYARTLAEDKAP